MKRFNPFARRKARQFALQAMYQWQLGGENLAEIEQQFLINNNMKKVDIDYFKKLLHGVPKMLTNIDDTMTQHLDRPIEELNPIELSIMRIAIYELKQENDVPYRVIINEALELAKKYGAVEGYRYVNGVLDPVARKIRADELKQKDPSDNVTE